MKISKNIDGCSNRKQKYSRISMDAPKIFKNINGSTIAMYCTNKVQKYLKNIDECSNKAQYQLISWVPEDLRSSSRPQSLESVVHYLRQAWCSSHHQIVHYLCYVPLHPIMIGVLGFIKKYITLCLTNFATFENKRNAVFLHIYHNGLWCPRNEWDSWLTAKF